MLTWASVHHKITVAHILDKTGISYIPSLKGQSSGEIGGILGLFTFFSEITTVPLLFAGITVNAKSYLQEQSLRKKTTVVFGRS